MNLNNSEIRDLILEELKTFKTDKKVTKHNFKKDNNYKTRTFTCIVNKETKEEDIKNNLKNIIENLLIDNISTTFVTNRQRYSKVLEASVLSQFSNIKFDNFYLMYHLNVINKYRYEEVSVDDELIQRYLDGKVNSSQFFTELREKEKFEVQVTFAIMYIDI